MTNQTPLRMEDLRVLQLAEAVSDDVWNVVSKWTPFARETVGKQWVRATDSVGANIAEAFGRYHYGEKLRFLYYARGSLFEMKFWLNRSRQRSLIEEEEFRAFQSQIKHLVRQLNAFVSVLKRQQHGRSEGIGEAAAFYKIRDVGAGDTKDYLFPSGGIEYLIPDP